MKKLLFLGVLLLSGCSSESHIRSRVVKLTSPRGSCTGTQVRTSLGNDVILTAAHCRVLEIQGSITVEVDGRRAIPRKVLEESTETDLLVLEGVPNLPGLKLADHTPATGSFLRAFTHGEGYPTYRSIGELVDPSKTVEIIEGFIQNESDELACSGKKHVIRDVNMFFFSARACLIKITTYVILAPSIRPGSSGGGFFNDSGDLVGVVSASNGVFAMIIPLNDVKEFLSSY